MTTVRMWFAFSLVLSVVGAGASFVLARDAHAGGRHWTGGAWDAAFYAFGAATLANLGLALLVGDDSPEKD